MRKGTGLVIGGSVLLIPPLCALGVLTVMKTRFGAGLLASGLALVGVQDFIFGVYVDPIVMTIVGTLGLGGAFDWTAKNGARG